MDNLSHIKMLFDSMIGNSDILMFGIYKEKSGSTLLKVRFADQDKNTSDGGTQNANVQFRRKSNKQVQRDIRRAQQHKHDSHTDPESRPETENPKCDSSSPLGCNSVGVHGEASPECPDSRVDSPEAHRHMHNINTVTHRHFTDILDTHGIDTNSLVDQSTAEEYLSDSMELDLPLTIQNSEISDDRAVSTQSQDGQFSNDITTHNTIHSRELVPGITGADFVRGLGQLDNETKMRLHDICTKTMKRMGIGNHSSDSSDNT